MKKFLIIFVLLFAFVSKVEAGWYCSGNAVTGIKHCPQCNEPEAPWCTKTGNWYCTNMRTGSCSGLSQADCNAFGMNQSRVRCGATVQCSTCNWVCAPGATTCGACSRSCGGGTQTCTNSCDTWEQSCNEQSCCTPNWVNVGCGDTTNGCGYESMRQTRTEACPARMDRISMPRVFLPQQPDRVFQGRQNHLQILDRAFGAAGQVDDERPFPYPRDDP